MADNEQLRPLKVELISECEIVQPGQTFHLGIRQQIAPGYHSYWRSPGTVGMPMQVEWDLPSGSTAGEILWPLPETSTMAAYTVWGYHNSALLVVPINVPKDRQPGDRVTLSATVSWMCCAKSCHPDKETLTITLPVGKSARTNKTARTAISTTLQAQPRPDPAWKVRAIAKGDDYRLIVTSSDRQATLPASAYFFDYDRQISSDKGQRVKRSDGTLRIRLFAEEHTGEKLPRLRGILVAESEWRPGLKALAIDTPITRNP